MKKILVLGLLSLSAQAFSQTCYVDMVDRANRVVRTFQGWGSSSSCMEGMRECRKSIRLDYSQNPQYPNGSLDCVQVTRTNTPVPPMPNPHPNPTPMPPVPMNGVVVTGILEDVRFTMMARDASELYINCLTDIRNIRVGSVDEVYFSVNNNRFVNATTQGWYSDSDICSLVEQEARRSTKIEYTSPMRIVGTLEKATFQIDAFDRASLLNNCTTNMRATGLGQTDEMAFSLNGAPFTRLTTPGWWSTTTRACKALIQNIDYQIR